MRITELLEHICNYAYNVVTIIVPDFFEKQLLLHRFYYNKVNCVDNKIEYDGKVIQVFTTDEATSNWNHVVNSMCYVEFPESVPEQFMRKLQFSVNDYTFTNEIV